MTKAERIKMAICGVLAGAALVMAVTALSDIGSTAIAAGDALTARSEETVYVLRDCDGYVGIFTGAAAKKPATVTDIRTGLLPQADQALLGEGISVYGWSELQQLLEDFGS